MPRRKTSPDEPSAKEQEFFRKTLRAAGRGELEWLDRLVRGSGYRRDDLSGFKAREIGDLFGVSPMAVSLWVRRDGCPRYAGGDYNLREVVRWWTERATREKTEKKDDEDGSGRRWREARASREELRLRREMGEFIPEVEVREKLIARAILLKRLLMELPRKMGPILEGMEAREIKTTLDEEIREFLLKLSGRRAPDGRVKRKGERRRRA